MGNYGSVNVPGVSGPELEAVRAIANSALEKANEALEGGGGSGCVLKITFDAEFAGQEYTVTDGAGDTKTGTVPESLVDSVSVKNCNTEYTVSASTASGEQYSATVTTGAYFGQYEVTLAVFTATITVTTAPSAEAKAVLGGSAYTATANGSGVAAISVKKAGKYTVSATISGKTSASVEVNVTEAGENYTATVKIPIAAIPSQGESLTYTGQAQTPTFDDYNSAELTLGGTTSGTNAGSYNASFTPKSGYQWSDGTTTAKTVAWSIAKAAGSLSLNPTSLSLNGDSPTGSVTVTRAGDGAITATSGDPDVVSVSVSGNKVNVTALDEGNVTVTVKVAAGTNHNAPANKTFTVNVTNMVHIYGASWDGSSTTKWTRTDEAAGFTDPVPYVQGAKSYSSPFDDLQPWAGMVKSERTGGTMVAIPKFWYKLTQNGNGLKIQIADRAQSGFSVSPAHMDRGDGKGERDVVYIGRYHCGTSSNKSTSGQRPKANITRSQARSTIHSLGANIWQMDFAMRFTIWLLYIVEFADWNSQAKIGYGCGNDSNTENMGYTDSMPYHTGTTKNSRTTYGCGTQYRNIEGLWDNVYDWMDGCYYNGNGLNIIKNPSQFSDSANGVNVGTLTSGYPSKFTVRSQAGFPVFVPSQSNGSDSTYSCDYWNFSSSVPCLFVGGYYYQYTDHGLFFVSYSSASYSYASIGCRLQELP